VKYPILFLIVSVLLAAFVFVILSVAAITEVKELIVRKAGLGDLSTD
jgi:hypothetical protein